MVYEALDHWATGVLWMLQHVSLYCRSQVLPLMCLDRIWLKHNGDLQGCSSQETLCGGSFSVVGGFIFAAPSVLGKMVIFLQAAF